MKLRSLQYYSDRWKSSVENTLKFSMRGGFTRTSCTFWIASWIVPEEVFLSVSSSCQRVTTTAMSGSSRERSDIYPRKPSTCRVAVFRIRSNSKNPLSRFPFLKFHVDILAKTKRLSPRLWKRFFHLYLNASLLLAETLITCCRRGTVTNFQIHCY